MTSNDDEIEDVPAPSSDGWPEHYFAVIFTNQRTMSDDEMYSLTSERMVELAQQQPGFLGVESVRGEDGIGITVSYWRDRGAIRDWRVNIEHLAAQQMGRQEFYSWYHIRVAEVVAHRSFDAGDMVAGDMAAGDIAAGDRVTGDR
jgi:heme-degrading monooxygenase HmoA